MVERAEMKSEGKRIHRLLLFFIKSIAVRRDNPFIAAINTVRTVKRSH
jgi:hypothetical protein